MSTTAASGDGAQEAKKYKDPETGEMLSKNELKKREKARQKAAGKAKPSDEGTKHDNQEEKSSSISAATKEEEELTPNQYFELRSRAVHKMLKSNDPYPYPHKFHVSISIPHFIEKYSHLQDGETLQEEEVTIAGRIYNMRSSGQKLRFYDIRADGEKVQVMAMIQDHQGARDFTATHEIFRRGDIIGVRGSPGKTKRGELSIMPRDMALLAPNLHMLPIKLTDQEQRYRYVLPSLPEVANLPYQGKDIST